VRHDDFVPSVEKETLGTSVTGKIKRDEADPWRHASSGTKAGWILEAIFSPRITSI